MLLTPSPLWLPSGSVCERECTSEHVCTCFSLPKAILQTSVCSEYRWLQIREP